MSDIKRPVLRYHGGKWMLAPWIISNFPVHDIYTEVFGGGGSVLMRKPRSRGEVYNDLCSYVVNVFSVLRDHDKASELKRILSLTPFSREEYESTNMESYENAGSDIEKARLTIVRSFQGFGGGSINPNYVTGFRANSHRSKDSGAAKDWANYSDSIPFFTKRLQGVIIENKDYKSVLLQQDGKKVLHYMDPPYLKSTRTSSKRNVYETEMSDEDHAEMLDIIQSLKGMVVLSGYDSEKYNLALKGWTVIKRKTKGDSASDRTEVLWLNKSAAQNNVNLPKLF